MGREEGKKSIREVLIKAREERANSLGARLRTLWITAENDILEAQNSPDGHAAGLTHVRRVEKNLSRLIPDDWKKKDVNATELFILSAASCLHDTGKVNPYSKDHGETGADYIRKNASVYGLTDKEAYWIGEIVRVHTKREELNDLDQILHGNGDKIHLRDLAALFCLADTLHCTSDRVLRCADRNHPKTKFRLQISDWFMDEQDDRCIKLEAFAKDPADIECLREGLELTRRDELSSISLQLRTAGYPSRIDTSTKLDPEFLENMLKGKTLERARETPVLDFYIEDDKDQFKGRKQETEELWANVLATRAAKDIPPISLFSGKSGVGKTSLIRAGLFPKLEETEWKHAHCRISANDPVKQIVTDLWCDLLPTDELPPKGFVNAIEQISNKYQDAKTLIVLDQFEQIVRVPAETLEDLKIGMIQIMARRFPNLYLLLAYQTETHDEVMSFLTSMYERIWHSPTCVLLPLSREGAREALETLFAAGGVGVDPNGSIADTILNDIDAQGQGFYPPFLQIVAKTLSVSAMARKSLVTLELYKELGEASGIIGTFLLSQLSGFGEEREIAENTLRALVGEGGFTRSKSFSELQLDTQVDASLLRGILERLVTKRLVRPLTNDQYEISHPYLARLVSQQLGEEERELKRLREYLLLKSREFESTKDLLSMTDLARLYCVRDRISPDRQEANLLMHCLLAGYGPSWYWIRNFTAEECTSFVLEALSHPNERVRKNATEMIAVLKGKDAFPHLKKMLYDSRSSVQEAAVWALANLGITEALPDIREMLDEDNWAVREAAVRALGRLRAEDASSKIEYLLHNDYYWQVRGAAVDVLVMLRGPEKLKEWIRSTDWRIKAPAIRCLSQLEGKESLSWLRSMLRDEKDWAVRTEVVLALTRLKDKESLEHLRKIADFEKDWRVKEAAIEASVLLEGENALQVAKMLLSNRDQYKRKMAARLVAQLGGKNDAPLIAGLLQDRWGIVRISAVNALTKLDGEKSLRRFFQMLKSDNEDVRKALARGIAKIGTDKEAMKLAKQIGSFKFGDWVSEANEALVRLDIKLYSPYQSKLRMLVEGTNTTA